MAHTALISIEIDVLHCIHNKTSNFPILFWYWYESHWFGGIPSSTRYTKVHSNVKLSTINSGKVLNSIYIKIQRLILKTELKNAPDTLETRSPRGNNKYNQHTNSTGLEFNKPSDNLESEHPLRLLASPFYRLNFKNFSHVLQATTRNYKLGNTFFSSIQYQIFHQSLNFQITHKSS